MPDDQCSTCSVEHKDSPLGWIRHGWECERCFRFYNPEIAEVAE